ncbi:hypothetical protein PV682_43960 [Streptomyces niveiscabiei]|uniref:hypothetical protein n=1 Tax=Streptomyces niveiscabiei TaxID=164115 RepID=UPI0029B9DE84|nr:hypothetical protein [Streptomyces niveiscabiei]MDX3388343.1 hypothetical protein [Streptomyces niveiscabiei]
MVKNCAVCGASFEPRKTHAAYCGKPCRDKAYRARKAAETPRSTLRTAQDIQLPEDDREALRELFRAAIARILADGLVVPGRRGEADVAHPLARFVGQWLTALGRGEAAVPDGSADDLDDAIARLLASTDDKGQAR